jgi:tetratricopeptide (TPR) repeat protein
MIARIAILLAALAALAQGAESPFVVAKKALEAHAKGDTKTLGELARLDNPDPWVVADLLNCRGEHEAALAFARAGSRPATEALPAYLAARRESAGADWQILEAAVRLMKKGENAQALAKLREMKSEGKDVIGILGSETAIRANEDDAEIAQACLVAAANAEAIGWLAQALRLCERGQKAARSAKRLDTARQVCEREVSIHTRLGEGEKAARAACDLGEMCARTGDQERAIAAFEQSLRTLRKESPDYARALFGLATSERQLRRFRDADTHFRQALRACKALGMDGQATACVAALAGMYTDLGEDAHAVERWRELEAWADKQGDRLRRGLAHQGFARSALLAGDYAKAREQIREALPEWEARKDERRIRDALFLRCMAELRMGDYEVAWKSYIAAGDPENVALRSIYHADRGEPQQALKYTEETVAQCREARSPHLGWILARLSVTRLATGDHVGARAAAEEALEFACSAGDGRVVCDALAALGSLEHAVGNYTAALRFHEQALLLRGDANNVPGVAESLSHLARVSADIGDHERAAACQARALGLYRSMGDRPGVADSLSHLARLLALLGETDAARAPIDEALALRQAMGAPALVARSLVDRARYERDAGRLPEARASLEQAIAAFREAGNRVEEARAQAALVTTLRRAGSPEARAEAQRALASAAELKFRECVVWNRCELAHLAEGSGKADEAIALAREAAQELMALGRGMWGEERGGLREQHASIFRVGARVALREKRLADLAFFLESGRGSGVLESLASRPAEPPSPERPEEARARLRRERQTWQYYRQAIEDPTEEGIWNRRRHLAAAYETAKGMVAALRAADEARQRAAPPEVATLDAMRATLRRGEVMVLFGVVPPDSVAIVLTPLAARLVSLGSAAVLENAAAPFAGNPEQIDPESAVRLAKLVIDPLGLDGTATRVLVSPDGGLGHVPFSLLLSGREVVLIPSGTVYTLLVRERSHRGNGVLAVAEPRASVRLLPGLEQPLVLSALPNAAQEAMRLGDVRLIGPDATRENLLVALLERPRWRSVHFACHGSAHPERPGLSLLALAPDENDVGLLTCDEVYGMRIPSDLVVLSACETGKGKHYRAEGIVGFTNAFLRAGTPRVLVSLWPVDDEATYALMERFYGHWKRGDTTPAEALRRAQQEVSREPMWRSPAFWAAWQLWGLPD